MTDHNEPFPRRSSSKGLKALVAHWFREGARMRAAADRAKRRADARTGLVTDALPDLLYAKADVAQRCAEELEEALLRLTEQPPRRKR